MEEIAARAAAKVSRRNEEVAQSEIEEDWLEHFRKTAVAARSESMKERYSRILAGEIEEPGKFSIKSVHAVGSINQETAEQFATACSASIGLRWPAEIQRTQDFQVANWINDRRIPELGTELGQNGLQKYGLSYTVLCNLMDHGLLQHDLNSWMSYVLSKVHRAMVESGVRMG